MNRPTSDPTRCAIATLALFAAAVTILSLPQHNVPQPPIPSFNSTVQDLVPPSIAPPHHDTPMGSIRVPDFVDDDFDFGDAWSKAINDHDTIANARGFLEEQFRK